MFNLTHHLLLEREVFKNRLNHEVTMRKTTVVEATGNQRQLSIALGRFQMATAYFLLQLIPAVFQRMVDTVGVDILNTYRQLALNSGNVGNTAAHQAAAQYTDRAQRARRNAGARIFFDIRTGKENTAQRTRLRRHRQLAKGASFRLVASAGAVRQPGFNHLEDFIRCRIVALRLLRGFLCRHAEQQMTPQRPRQNTIAHRQTAMFMMRFTRIFRSGVEQNRTRHNLIHQPHFQRLTCAKLFAGQNHVQRGTDANQTR